MYCELICPILPARTSGCTGDQIVNQRFCVANELIGRLIAKALYPDGTALTMIGTFTNFYGQSTSIQVDLRMWMTTDNTRDVDRPPELGILPDFGACCCR